MKKEHKKRNKSKGKEKSRSKESRSKYSETNNIQKNIENEENHKYDMQKI